MNNLSRTGKISFYIIALFFCSFSTRSANENESIILENFEDYQGSRDLFKKWMLRDNDDKNKAVKIYSIVSENADKYLKADSLNDSIQIAKKVNWRIESYPVIRWKWRANKLPEKGNEKVSRKNDSGAAIYIVFQRASIPFLSWKYQPINVIKYVWSTSLPPGQVVKKYKKKLGNTIYEGRFIVIESGNTKLNTWISEERNVLEDYINNFGKRPDDDPVLIAILTDSNNTKSAASADYDDLVIKKGREGLKNESKGF